MALAPTGTVPFPLAPFPETLVEGLEPRLWYITMRLEEVRAFTGPQHTPDWERNWRSTCYAFPKAFTTSPSF